MCDVFHENLKAARLKKGLSQQEVADQVGVAKSTYSMWETGNREPNLMRIKALRNGSDNTGQKYHAKCKIIVDILRGAW